MPIDSHLPQADPFSLVPTFKEESFVAYKCSIKASVSGTQIQVIDNIVINMVLPGENNCFRTPHLIGDTFIHHKVSSALFVIMSVNTKFFLLRTSELVHSTSTPLLSANKVITASFFSPILVCLLCVCVAGKEFAYMYSCSLYDSVEDLLTSCFSSVFWTIDNYEDVEYTV